jgi:hypothetical protein
MINIFTSILFGIASLLLLLSAIVVGGSLVDNQLKIKGSSGFAAVARKSGVAFTDQITPTAPIDEQSDHKSFQKPASEVSATLAGVFIDNQGAITDDQVNQLFTLVDQSYAKFDGQHRPDFGVRGPPLA